MMVRNSLWAARGVALGASRATASTDSLSDGCHAGIHTSTAAGYSSPGEATPITRYGLRPYGSMQLTSDDGRVAGEMFSPRSVAEHEHEVRTGSFIGRLDEAAKQRSCA